MTDPFAVFGLPRRPWLEQDVLKEQFHRLTAEHHPDIKGGDEANFAEVNAAYTTLRDPARRLSCFLALEGFEIRREVCAPDDLGQLFMDTGLVRQKIEAFLKKEENTRSPIGKAMLAAEKYEVMDEVEAQISVLSRSRDSLIEEICKIDGSWPGDAQSNARRLAKIADSLTFVGKWINELREGYARLAI